MCQRSLPIYHLIYPISPTVATAPIGFPFVARSFRKPRNELTTTWSLPAAIAEWVNGATRTGCFSVGNSLNKFLGESPLK